MRDSNTTAVATYARRNTRDSYYNGVAGYEDHPPLLYRSDYFKTLYPTPSGRFFRLPIKSIHGVFNTPLNKVWENVRYQIRDLLKARNIKRSAIDPARFVTEGQDHELTIGPVVIWVGVCPDSTSSETAHNVPQEILALLKQNGVDDVEVE